MVQGGGHIRSVKEARETLGLLAVELAVGAGSGDPEWRLTVGTRNGAHHTEASQWARNGGSQWRRHEGGGGVTSGRPKRLEKP